MARISLATDFGLFVHCVWVVPTESGLMNLFSDSIDSINTVNSSSICQQFSNFLTDTLSSSSPVCVNGDAM